MTVGIAIWIVALVLLVVAFWWLTGPKGEYRGGTSGPGPAAVGAFYEMLSEEKRNALEVIVEQKAAERRPEYPDGNLPDLENPIKPPKDEE